MELTAIVKHNLSECDSIQFLTNDKENTTLHNDNQLQLRQSNHKY